MEYETEQTHATNSYKRLCQSAYSSVSVAYGPGVGGI